MARQPIHSMISALPTLPALLEHANTAPPSRGFHWLQGFLVVFAGCAHAVSMAWPWSFGLPAGQPVWWLQLLAMMMFTAQLDGCRSFKRAAWLGELFGTAMLCSTFWWLYISMHNYGGLAAPLTLLAVFLLAAALALYYAIAAGLFALLAPRLRVPRALVFAALWLMAELARVQIFTGFPWGEGGYAHVDGWARQLAEWVGVHGLTFLAAFAAAWLAMALRAQRTAWVMATAIVAASVVLARWPADGVGVAGQGRSTPAMGVTLLQGNIPQDQKFESGTGIATALRWYGEQLQAARTPLVVAPETAIPLLPQQLPAPYWTALTDRFASGQQAALIGLPLGNTTSGYANSVIGLKPAAPGAARSEPYRYDKHHLVPFGEFVPPGFRWFIDMMNIPLGDFSRGAVGQVSFEWQGQRLAPNICYEDLFGEELGARFADPARAPTVFVNVSNIAWFGNTVAIDQHLHISRMRALEFDRPMIRATNTGATVIINHRGQVTHSLPPHTRGALVGEVVGRTGITPYAQWVSRYGLWPLWGLCLALVALALVFRRR
ncbi:apolipoprotein N-acyltransferase [Polaromonas sp. YR568]|uniref:apolipoprotein N-acyltransferase n=1 Tax=Polaromonas sp. YR568 TaxID=1855301 RepID=UPI003137F615